MRKTSFCGLYSNLVSDLDKCYCINYKEMIKL